MFLDLVLPENILTETASLRECSRLTIAGAGLKSREYRYARKKICTKRCIWPISQQPTFRPISSLRVHYIKIWNRAKGTPLDGLS
jgi:hypothetical protein